MNLAKFDYPDTGCKLHARCVTCPFERCVVEASRRSREWVRRQLHAGVEPNAVTFEPPRRMPRVPRETYRDRYLTDREMQTLRAILDAAPTPVSTSELCRTLGASVIQPTVVRVHISNLRRKLAPYGLDRWIVARWGEGYSWVEQTEVRRG